jgi:hypothetical protein
MGEEFQSSFVYNHVHGLEKGAAQKGEEVERSREAFEEEFCAHQELKFLSPLNHLRIILANQYIQQ